MLRRGVLLLAAVLLLAVAHSPPAYASEADHKYKTEEPVKLWVNKVGPYNNPQETYNYYSLPFCQPSENPAHKWGGLGEVLGGNELIDSQIDIKFIKNVDKGAICTIELDAQKVQQFANAIENSYWFELFIGFVGETDKNNENKHYLYTHKNIVIKYNGNRIIHVNLTQESPKLLEAGKKLDMTYSVKWVQTNVAFARMRFEVYLDYPFFEHQIHWFSMFNSFMMVIFLTGLVSMILMRTLRNDYAKYAREDDDLESLERDVNEEPGGSLFMLAALILLVIVLAIVGMLYVGRGAIITTFIVCYALTSFISGYVSGGLYSRNGGKNWIKAMILTASLFPFLCFSIGLVLNTIAIFYRSLAAIPFGTMVVMFVLWAFISFPLVLLGTVVGRNWSGAPNNPCRVKTIPRPIPEKKWYLTPSVISLIGGLLPFGSIFIEMYFVFTSFWNYKVYYVYGFMLLVFVILIIVIICVTIVGTYFLLNAENYHWQWTSFFSAASTALCCWVFGLHPICEENLQKYQMRLNLVEAVSMSCHSMEHLIGGDGAPDLLEVDAQDRGRVHEEQVEQAEVPRGEVAAPHHGGHVDLQRLHGGRGGLDTDPRVPPPCFLRLGMSSPPGKWWPVDLGGADRSVGEEADVTWDGISSLPLNDELIFGELNPVRAATSASSSSSTVDLKACCAKPVDIFLRLWSSDIGDSFRRNRKTAGVPALLPPAPVIKRKHDAMMIKQEPQALLLGPGDDFSAESNETEVAEALEEYQMFLDFAGEELGLFHGRHGGFSLFPPLDVLAEAFK
ncbi:unnamed protein product [Miscanthus lutarioriparius]|uniref:Transmembrane 9 superfamily member n=1 Tax=Miscanthus lutarioriparius TaxID=422564 RepID=A0A811Q264_9POAL|nr:unnamed protein product [Miscanthus lutarioriparius]